MKPCTGCGSCCLAERCQAAIIADGPSDSICPFLKFTGPRYHCLLVDTERKAGVEPLIARALGIGIGCTNEAKS